MAVLQSGTGRRRTPILIPVIFLLAGCDGATGEAGPIPVLSAEPGRRIGGVDDPTVGFSQVGGVEVDREGNLIVFEVAVPEIRVYSPDGTILRRIGRRGAGPGEFESPGAFGFGLVGDTIWVTETFSRRLTLFDRSGELLAANRFEPVLVLLPDIHGLVVPRSLRSDGRFTSFLGVIQSSPDQPPTGVEPDDSIPVPIVLFDSDGSVSDTIGWMDRPPPRMWRRPQEEAPLETINFAGRRIIVPRAPSTLPDWIPLDDGYIEVVSSYVSSPDATFQVRRIGLQHDTIWDRAIPYQPTPYTSAELDALAESAAKGQGGGGFSRPIGAAAPAVPDDWEGALPRVRAAMSFPEYQLPVQYSWLAQDGALWIRLQDDPSGASRWLILEADGTTKGELELPGNARPIWSRGETFWALVPDDLEVQWLVEHQIRQG